MVVLNTLALGLALGVALALRPWRSQASPPWPWLLVAGLLPLLWSADRLSAAALLQPMSGACLLLLMAGWPLTVLALLPVTLATAWLGGLDLADALQRAVSLGLLPATLGLLGGAAVRLWLPAHLMVYILARGFGVTAIAVSLSGALALWAQPELTRELSRADLLLARWLSAWGEAFITGMLTAIFVAFRPQWLATYADRLYLPR